PECRGISNNTFRRRNLGLPLPSQLCTAGPLFVFLVLFWFLWFSGSGSPGGPDSRLRYLPFSLAHSDDHIAGPQTESCKRLRRMSFVSSRGTEEQPDLGPFGKLLFL